MTSVIGLPFVPEHACAGVRNVVVDGSPNPDTVLTLSHWPGSPTPPGLRADLSAQIVFRALAQPSLFDGIEAVTNNHFDQDGLAGIFALHRPELAAPREAQLVDLARAGDFGTFDNRNSARVAMVIAAFDDDARSPLADELAGLDYPQRCGVLYEWMIPRLPELLDHVETWQPLWVEEDAHLTASLAAIASGSVVIAEEPSLDLAVVRVPNSFISRAASRFTIDQSSPVHPMAVNSSTACTRVATLHGAHYRLELRYETWVRLMSRRVLPRVDLRPLAVELDALEPHGTRWRAAPPSALTPTLETLEGDDSGLTPDVFLAAVRRLLATAPPAWDPSAAT